MDMQRMLCFTRWKCEGCRWLQEKMARMLWFRILGMMGIRGMLWFRMREMRKMLCFEFSVLGVIWFHVLEMRMLWFQMMEGWRVMGF